MLVGCYDDMEKEELAGLLRALIKFLKACPSSSNEYVEESSHLLLLFAAQKFATAMACQLLIWEVMMDLCRNSPAFMSELDGATIAVSCISCSSSSNRPAEQIYIADHPVSTVVLYQISCHYYSSKFEQSRTDDTLSRDLGNF